MYWPYKLMFVMQKDALLRMTARTNRAEYFILITDSSSKNHLTNNEL